MPAVLRFLLWIAGNSQFHPYAARWPAAFRRPAAPQSPTSMKALLQFSERFGSMLSRLLLTLLYFALLGPFALVYQLFADPLHLKRRPSGNWTAWVSRNETLAQARRQD